VLGDPVELKPVITPPQTHPITSWKWELKHSYDGCTKDWILIGVKQEIKLMQNLVVYSAAGEYTFRLTVTYGMHSGGGQPPAPGQVEIVVNIGEVDGVRIESGGDGEHRQFLEQHHPPGIEHCFLVEFVLTSGGSDVGPFLAGTAQERLRDQLEWGHPAPDTVWGGEPEYWIHVAKHVFDYKFVVNPDLFPFVPVGFMLFEYKQDIRFVWVDKCDVIRGEDNVIGTFKVEHRKFNNTDYDLNVMVVGGDD
jgi:hypothetical protein